QEELDGLCADVKLAACMGYLKINDVSAIDELTLKMKPSNVNLLAGRKLSRREREEYCAQYVSNRIKSLVSKA
ncbi:MAG: hypothetical protein K2L72_01860, partial [Clostridia bacterium]|nr:hypothetical protein [Clostridia bacterium]